MQRSPEAFPAENSSSHGGAAPAPVRSGLLRRAERLLQEPAGVRPAEPAEPVPAQPAPVRSVPAEKKEPRVIVQSDGIFRIQDGLETSGVKLDPALKQLVDAVLR